MLIISKLISYAFIGPENLPTSEPAPQKDVKPSNGQQSKESMDENLRKLPKPPVSIRSFDLVANLPTTRQPDESDEEESYEVFDEQIVEQHKRNSLVNSGTTARQNSVESIFQPPISVEQEEDYEIYESITESVYHCSYRFHISNYFVLNIE